MGEEKVPKRSEKSSVDKQGGEGAEKGRQRNIKGRKRLDTEAAITVKESKWLK